MIRRAISLGFVGVAAQVVDASQPVLMLGALPANCLSALHIGVVTCDSNAAESPSAGSITEAQVNEYLAQYGKPPREAVRALLNPTDDNIAAWIRKQREVVAIASYVASRMTQLGSQFEGEWVGGTPMLKSDLPAAIQMRVTLLLKLDNPSSLRAVRALQILVNRYPSIDGRLVQVGPLPDGGLRSSLTKLGAVLPISVSPLETMESVSGPSLLIEDLRYRVNRRLDATDMTTDQMCDQIIALRAAAEARYSHLKPTWPTP
jgi:hypothetical protein